MTIRMNPLGGASGASPGAHLQLMGGGVQGGGAGLLGMISGQGLTEPVFVVSANQSPAELQATRLRACRPLTVGVLCGVLGACGPGNSEVTRSAAVAVQSPNLIRRVSRALPQGGGYSVERFLDERGIPADRFLGESGSILSRSEVDALERAAREWRWQRQGAMSDRLYEQWRSMSDSEHMRVEAFMLLREHPSVRETRSDSLASAEIARLEPSIRERLVAYGATETTLSTASPYFRTVLSRASLSALARSGLVSQLDPAPSPPMPMGTEWYPNVGAAAAVSAGWTGVDRRVAIIEDCRPADPNLLSGVIETAHTGGCAGWHTISVASVVRSVGSPWGVASYAGILIGNFVDYSGDIFAWANSRVPDVVNFSYGPTAYLVSSGSNYGFLDGGITASDMQHDWWVLRYPYALFTLPAGNMNHGSAIPLSWQHTSNRAYNGVNVGGSDQTGTAARSDDAWISISTWRNHTTTHADRELPEIVAPIYLIDTGSVTNQSGTSVAAPQAAGAIALIRERNPFQLATGNWPEAQKAMLLATADCDIDGVTLSLSDSVDDRDGAGLLNVYRAVVLADPANRVTDTTARVWGFRYGSMYFSSSFVSGVWQQDTHVITDASGRVRIVLTWDATPVCSGGSSPSSCTGETIDADLNLTLFTLGGSQVATSASFDNNYEVITATASPNTEYIARVSMVGTPSAYFTYFGMAWAPYPTGCPNP